MEAQSFDLIEEFHSEDIKSVNHSKIIHRLSVALARYRDQYDILPELELALPAGKCKPDVCIYPILKDDWKHDILFYDQPPLVAIEIQSPKQATTDLTDKMYTIYFPSGIESVWIIVPPLQIITIRTPQGKNFTFTDGVIKDPVTQTEIAFSDIFR